jgi:hypothetical protein
MAQRVRLTTATTIRILMALSRGWFPQECMPVPGERQSHLCTPLGQ